MDTSEFRKPRPDFPIVPQSAILRPRVKGFRVPKGRKGKKPRGRTKTPQQPQAPPIPDRYKEAQIQEIRDSAKDRRERLRLEQEISRETIRYRERKAEREERQQAVRTIEGRRQQQLQDRLIQDQARHFTQLLEYSERRAGEVQSQYQEFLKQVLSQRNIDYEEPDIQFFPASGTLFEEEEEAVVVGGLRKPEVVRPSPAVAQSFKQAGLSGGLSLEALTEELEAGSPPAGLPDPSPIARRGAKSPKEVIKETTFAQRAGIGEVKPPTPRDVDVAIEKAEQTLAKAPASVRVEDTQVLQALRQLRKTMSQQTPTQPLSPEQGRLFRELEKQGEKITPAIRAQSRGRVRPQDIQPKPEPEPQPEPVATAVRTGVIDPDRAVLSPTTGLRALGSDEDSPPTSEEGLTYEQALGKFGTAGQGGKRVAPPKRPAGKPRGGRTPARAVKTKQELRAEGFRGASPEPQPAPQPSPAQQLGAGIKKIGKRVRRSGTPKPRELTEEDTQFLTQARQRYADEQEGNTQTLAQIELSDRYLDLIGGKNNPVKYSRFEGKLGDAPIQLATQSTQDIFVRINEAFDTSGAGKQAGVYKLRQLPASRDADTDSRNKRMVLQSVFGTGQRGNKGILEDIATINPYKTTGGVNRFEKAIQEGKIQFFLKSREEEGA